MQEVQQLLTAVLLQSCRTQSPLVPQHCRLWNERAQCPWIASPLPRCYITLHYTEFLLVRGCGTCQLAVVVHENPGSAPHLAQPCHWWLPALSVFPMLVYKNHLLSSQQDLWQVMFLEVKRAQTVSLNCLCRIDTLFCCKNQRNLFIVRKRIDAYELRGCCARTRVVCKPRFSRLK